MTDIATDATADTVRIPLLDRKLGLIHLRGTSPLICHRWSEKAKEQMLAKQMKKASPGKAAKDPEQDYRSSLYVMPGKEDEYGFPSVAFKAAAVRAGTYADLKMTFLRGAFHVPGELVPVIGTPQPREDMVRISTTTDIRYRAEFPEWECRVPITWNANAISLEQIVNLFQIAGFSVGIGEWRPERNGQYGTFEVV